ncbi:hypothetical protein GCM10023216_01180 [Isoptericola chiayiensis]|uniref:Uncharacterized protein n=1 Tax=Isoptericola chiayiensis TaxID=579446 RepID=A0ABP8XY18_9MICO|nr:hypothetical protein [Isoptericola chiayiensis]NOW01320.1 hypothetical protein [Isoptericola chiayiensis]
MAEQPPQAELTASTADRPGTSSPRAQQVASAGLAVLVQCGFVWMFVGEWLANVQASAGDPARLWLSVATATLLVGTVVGEAVLLARRRREPSQVAVVAMALVQIAWFAESF